MSARHLEQTVIICGSGNPVNNQTNFIIFQQMEVLTLEYCILIFIPTDVLENEIYKMAFFNSNNITLLCTISQSGNRVLVIYLKKNKTVALQWE